MIITFFYRIKVKGKKDPQVTFEVFNPIEGTLVTIYPFNNSADEATIAHELNNCKLLQYKNFIINFKRI